MVLDPFGGSGTTALVANTHGRDALLLEINPAYAMLAEVRLRSLAATAPAVSRHVPLHAAAIPMRRVAAQGA
jgi:DNA modification methylase